jgi:hypothetical protein
MTQKIDNTKINAAVDMLIESNVDFSNALGESGLIKQRKQTDFGESSANRNG